MESALQKALREYQEALAAEHAAGDDYERDQDVYNIAKRRLNQTQCERINAGERLLDAARKED